ncbi:rCG34640 [Rattus norvegicus]|uniref:RCG34640 n=1 Tax=Rattus norvegicus TaxID=10116 RepID=A6HDG9_RAT|nr:rCG34640 [Rattus norvegicus]
MVLLHPAAVSTRWGLASLHCRYKGLCELPRHSLRNDCRGSCFKYETLSGGILGLRSLFQNEFTPSKAFTGMVLSPGHHSYGPAYQLKLLP